MIHSLTRQTVLKHTEILVLEVESYLEGVCVKWYVENLCTLQEI